jgi:hypothetical protein
MSTKLFIEPGTVYSRLCVIREVARVRPTYRRFLFRCECGAEKEIDLSPVHRGSVMSCGCLGAERRVKSNRYHGLKRHPLYSVWVIMRQRCNNFDGQGYENYGGRGIKVCARWNDFQNFFDDMSPTYEKGLSIERKDNDGDYCKDNCIWATRYDQSRNKRNNHYVKLNENIMILKDAANKIGVSSSKLLYLFKKSNILALGTNKIEDLI